MTDRPCFFCEGVPYCQRMRKKCEHLEVDGWHVPTQEARELVRSSGSRYSWRDQLRAEMAGDTSKWMWPGLVALLAFGLYIRDWMLITGAVVGLGFFLYQAISVVRALRAGQVMTGKCDRVVRSQDDGDESFCAQVQIGKRRQDVQVHCQRCVEAVQAGMTVEVMVVVDPGDTVNNWMVGYRPL